MAALYICRDIFTSVENPLQISSFMQNKANLPDDQMNVTAFYTRDYENNPLRRRGENKANSKPNKANLLKAKMNVNKVLTKDYENMSNWAIYKNEPNSNPIQSQSNPISKAKNAAAYDTGDCHRKILKKKGKWY